MTGIQPADRADATDLPAVFDLPFRRCPFGGGYTVFAGLEPALEYQSLRFDGPDLDYLRSLGLFDTAFLDVLAGLRFTGEVRAVPEGTIVFPDEPIVEVSAPVIEAELVETAVLNFCHLQTLLASKAARCVIAARGRAVVEFGLRRTHGIDAGMQAARCAYLAGAAMSSNVLAGLLWHPPHGNHGALLRQRLPARDRPRGPKKT